MNLIDTHAHIDAEEFNEDINDVIARAFDGGIESIIIPAIEPNRYEKLFKLSELNKNIFIGMGVHPHNAKELDKIVLNEIYDNASKNKKVVAIGEIGLDYYYDFAPKETQKRALREQLEIAKDLNLPAIIHNRESDEDLLEIIQEAQDGKLRGVFHCFYGDEDFLKKVLELNFIVSFTGNITFKKFNAIDTVKNVPMDKFMLETDSPYMTPVPFRGKRNEPSFVNYVADKVAEIKNIDKEEVIKMTTNNAKKFFGLISILFLLVFSSLTSFSQDAFEDDYYEDEPLAPTYYKFIGFGPVIGANTIVESFTPRPNNVSYEGLLSLGGIVHVGVLDYLILSASYVYSKNTKLQEQFDDLQPNTHRQLELTANFIANPHAKINLYGFVGPSLLMNSYGSPGGGLEERNGLGFNTGLGFFFNIPISGAGLITFSAEWKLNFMLNSQKFDYDSRLPAGSQLNNPVEISTFFSIPRANIIFYPQF
jgi:TatD DNase family protein